MKNGDLGELAEHEILMIKEFRAGRGIIANFTLGVGIRINPDDDGRGRISISPNPAVGQFSRSQLTEIVRSWERHGVLEERGTANA